MRAKCGKCCRTISAQPLTFIHKLWLTFVLLLCAVSGSAQSGRDSLSVVVFPYDSYSENLLELAKVSVYEADSVTCLADSLRGIYNYASDDSGERRWLAGFCGTLPRRAG